jgi:hypothetical protein
LLFSADEHSSQASLSFPRFKPHCACRLEASLTLENASNSPRRALVPPIMEIDSPAGTSNPVPA